MSSTHKGCTLGTSILLLCLVTKALLKLSMPMLRSSLWASSLRCSGREGGKRKDSLQLCLWNLNICIKKIDVKCWLAEMTLVMTSLPLACAFMCFSMFVYIILCSFTLQADWRKSDRSVNGESQENWRWNSNYREKVASFPSFSRPAGERPGELARMLVKVMMQVHECQSWQPLLRHPVSEIQFDSPQNFRAKQVVKKQPQEWWGVWTPSPSPWICHCLFLFPKNLTATACNRWSLKIGGLISVQLWRYLLTIEVKRVKKKINVAKILVYNIYRPIFGYIKIHPWY